MENNINRINDYKTDRKGGCFKTNAASFRIYIQNKDVAINFIIQPAVE